ncbi:hypothetical protein L484_011338 [Morus notabilis]|uniref:Sm domain-containing protein n=1 Tax=Morus notabilis TaxID=981085 RepID=W9QV21_9ROSA|nr:hypothetical protein L484_011338 [Morus notabilis]
MEKTQAKPDSAAGNVDYKVTPSKEPLLPHLRLPAPTSATITHINWSSSLFFSYFKELVGREVTVELKNDLAIRGTLHSVDQYLNIKLENTRVVDQDKYPHMLSVRNCFIRGSVVRYVQLPPEGVDVELLHDATRREARGG